MKSKQHTQSESSSDRQDRGVYKSVARKRRRNGRRSAWLEAMFED